MNSIKLPFNISLLPWIDGVWIVGGSVRDLLSGHPCFDYDIAVSRNPEEFAESLSRRVGGHLVKLGRPNTALYRIIESDRTFDITALKGATIEKDLMERDFTINAMAYDPASRRLVDPLHGRADIEVGTLKMVSQHAFKKDPVRLLRAFRICAEYGFQLDPVVTSRIREDGPRIQESPPERILTELFRIFSAPKTADIVAAMADTRLLFHLLPELEDTDGCIQNRHHAFDVFQHTIKALASLEEIHNNADRFFPETAGRILADLHGKRFAVLKWAMLLHDIGKPATRSVDENQGVHFFGHEKMGAEMAADICRRLRFSRSDADDTVFFVRNHIKPLFLHLVCRKPGVSARAKARFFLKTGHRAPALVLHAAADILGKSDNPDERNDAFLSFSRDLLREYIEVHREQIKLPALVTGHDLIREFNLPPSPVVGKILDRIREARLSGEIRDSAGALRLAREMIRR